MSNSPVTCSSFESFEILKILQPVQPKTLQNAGAQHHSLRSADAEQSAKPASHGSHFKIPVIWWGVGLREWQVIPLMKSNPTFSNRLEMREVPGS